MRDVLGLDRAFLGRVCTEVAEVRSREGGFLSEVSQMRNRRWRRGCARTVLLGLCAEASSCAVPAAQSPGQALGCRWSSSQTRCGGALGRISPQSARLRVEGGMFLVRSVLGPAWVEEQRPSLRRRAQPRGGEDSSSLRQGPGYLFLEVSEANKRKCHAVLRQRPDGWFGLCFLLKRGGLCPAAQDRSGPDFPTSELLWCGALGEGAAELAGSQRVFSGPGDGLLSLSSPLQQERLRSGTGPPGPWLAGFVVAGSRGSHSCGGMRRKGLVLLRRFWQKRAATSGSSLCCRVTEESLCPASPCAGVRSSWDGEG